MARFSSVYKNRFPTARVVSGENTYEKGMLFTNQALGPGFSHTLFNLDIDSTSGVLTIPGGFNINKVAAGATYVDKFTLGNGDIENVIVTQPRNEYFLRAFEGINNIISVQKLNAKNILQQVKNAPQYLSQNDKAVCYKIITYNPFNHRAIVITLIESPEASYVLEDGVTLHRINANPISAGFSELWEKDEEGYISNVMEDLFPYGVEDIFTVRPRRVRLNETFNTKLFHDYYMQTVPNSEGFGNKNFIFTQKNTSIAENDEYIEGTDYPAFYVSDVEIIELATEKFKVGDIVELWPEVFLDSETPPELFPKFYDIEYYEGFSVKSSMISRHIIEVREVTESGSIYDYKTISRGKFLRIPESGSIKFHISNRTAPLAQLQGLLKFIEFDKFDETKASAYVAGDFSKVYKYSTYPVNHTATGSTKSIFTPFTYLDNEDNKIEVSHSVPDDAFYRGMLLTSLGVRYVDTDESPSNIKFKNNWIDSSGLPGHEESTLTKLGVEYLSDQPPLKLNLTTGRLHTRNKKDDDDFYSELDLFELPVITNNEPVYGMSNVSLRDIFKTSELKNSDTLYVPDLLSDKLKRYIKTGQSIRVAAYCELDVPLPYDTSVFNLREDVDLPVYYTSKSTDPYCSVFLLEYTWNGIEWVFSFVDTYYRPRRRWGDANEANIGTEVWNGYNLVYTLMHSSKEAYKEGDVLLTGSEPNLHNFIIIGTSDEPELYTFTTNEALENDSPVQIGYYTVDLLKGQVEILDNDDVSQANLFTSWNTDYLLNKGSNSYPLVTSNSPKGKTNSLTYIDVVNTPSKMQKVILPFIADNKGNLGFIKDDLSGSVISVLRTDPEKIYGLDLEETLSDIVDNNQSANNFKKLNNTQFGAFELPPKKLNPALAARWGYNMLDPAPYNFICEDIPGSDAFIFTGVLTKFNGQTVLNPIVNTDVDLTIYFNGDFGTIEGAPEAETIEKYFTTIKEMVEFLNNSTDKRFKKGFKLLTSGTNFVVESVESSDEEYTYTTDKALIEDIGETPAGVVQIGYYRITQLESDTGPTPRYLQLKVSYSSPDGEWNILKEFTVNETHDLIGKGLPITVPFKSPVENLLLKVELINTDPRLRIDVPSSAESEMITKYAVKAYQDVAIPFVKTAAQAQAKLENYDLGTALGITYWKSRLVLWGVENADDVLFLSDPNAPDYFPYPTGIDIFEENIKHAIRYGDSLIVFTDTKLWRLDMNADGLSWTKSLLQQNIRIDDKDIPYITIIKNMLFFKSDKQFYMLVPQRSGVEGELTIAPISRNIEDFLDKPFDHILEILSIPYPEINKKDKTPMEYLVKYGVHIEQNKVFVDWWFDIKAWKNNEVILSNREIVDNLEGGEFWLIQLVYDTQLYSWTLRFHTLPSIGEFINDAANSNTDYISLIYTPTLLNKNGKEVFKGYNEPTYGVSISNRGATPDKNYIEFNIVNSKLLNPEYKRVQFLDTGYKEVASPIIKKQFREIQISFEPRSSDVGFNPIMEANIDGHEVLPMTTPKIETELIDGVNIIKITEDINYQNINSLEHASQFTVDGELSNTFILDSTTLEGVKYIKVRKAINGKGYLIRLKFANVTEADYRISGHNFVYRSKNAR